MPGVDITTSLFLSSVCFADSQVFVASNQITGNILFGFTVADSGNIRSSMRVPTGGVGTGAGLGNQGGIAVGQNMLAVVNAGSNDVSLFDTRRADGLKFINKVNSGGVRPVSVAFAGDKYLYVLNAGDSETPSSVIGYSISRKQGLTTIEGSLRLLSSPAAGPAQLAFSPDNKWLAVTEKATNAITTFAFDKTTGLLSTASTVPSNGQTPFGFGWADRDTLVVSEAFGGTDSAVSEYDIDAAGSLRVVSGSVDAGDERAACWIEISDEGRYAYTTNTMTNSISSYRRDRKGGLTLLEARALATNAGPIDFGLAGRVGVVLNNSGSIQSFKVDKATGMLTLVDSETGLPAGTNGLAILSAR